MADANMKKKSVLIGVGILAVLLLLAGAIQNVVARKQAERNKPKPDPALVFTPAEVTRPERTAMPVIVEFSGPLVAPQTAVVRAKSSGTLLTLTVAEGQRVKAGQALGRVDQADLDHRLTERRAMLEAARAQATQAQRTHESNQRLADEKFISPNALEASRVALDAARANARAAEAQLGTVRAAANLATLVAPIDGIVAKRHVVPGEKLSPEQQVITIVDVRKLEVAGSVGTHEVTLLKAGMAMDVAVEGLSATRRGTLARIAPAAESGTRSIGVAVTLDNADEALRAGQYAVVRVSLASGAPRLTVPTQAVVSVAGQDYVWMIENGALARRAVTTGLRDGATGRVELLNGATPDSVLLALKFENLREGQKASVGTAAEVVPGKSAPAASATASTNASTK